MAAIAMTSDTAWLVDKSSMNKGPRPQTGAPIPSGDGVTYRMRGYDTTLTTIVFWDAPIVDASATYYTGPGPVTGIVVQKQIGAD